MSTIKSICALAVASANVAQAAYPPTNMANECCVLFKEQHFEGATSYELCNGAESLLPHGWRENVESWACSPGAKVQFCESVDGDCKPGDDESEYAGSSQGYFWNASMGRRNLINRVFVNKANNNTNTTTIYEGPNCTGASARLEYVYGEDNYWVENLVRQGIDPSTQFRSIMMAPESYVRWQSENFWGPKIIQNQRKAEEAC